MRNKLYSVRYEATLKHQTKKKLDKLSEKMRISKSKVIEKLINDAYDNYIPAKEKYGDKELKRLIEIAKYNWLDD